MRLQTQDSPIQRHNVTEPARHASIEMNAAAFDVLSSAIYTNKPMAVIRELCCNALDSHLAAKQDRPFEVYLPSQINPDFVVKDFGLGLSDEAILSLYMTYFHSNKRLTDELIGGFGLGSKSPLAYTDSFVVISTYNGHRRTYSVFKDETGTPSVQRMDEELTDEHNGLEVRVSVASHDFYLFQSTAQQLLAYFPPGAVICPSHPNTVVPVDYSAKQDKWGLRKHDLHSGIRAIVGPVAYRIDLSVFNSEFFRQEVGSSIYELDAKPYDLFFDVGDVSVAVSRESLQMNDKTKKAILDHIILARKEEVAAYLTKLKRAPDIFRRLQTFSEMTALSIASTPGVKDFIRTEFNIDITDTNRILPWFNFSRLVVSSRTSESFSTRHETMYQWLGGVSLSSLRDKSSASGTIQAPIFIYKDENLRGSYANFLANNEELRPYIETPYGVVFVTPLNDSDKASFEWFRDHYFPSVVRLSDLINERPARRWSSSKSSAQKAAYPRAVTNQPPSPYAAKHYFMPYIAQNGSIATAPMSDPLDPNGAYCFVTREELFRSVSDHGKYTNAIVSDSLFRKTTLRGAQLVGVYSNPPKMVRNLITGFRPLSYYLDSIQESLLHDQKYQIARSTISRYIKAAQTSSLPIPHPDRLSYATNSLLGQFPTFQKLLRMVNQVDSVSRRVAKYRAAYDTHLELDVNTYQDRPATFLERFATYYAKYPLLYLIASRKLQFNSFYGGLQLEEFAILSLMLQQENINV